MRYGWNLFWETFYGNGIETRPQIGLEYDPRLGSNFRDDRDFRAHQ